MRITTVGNCSSYAPEQTSLRHEFPMSIPSAAYSELGQRPIYEPYLSQSTAVRGD